MDPDKPKPGTSGIKKPSAIPSMGTSRLPARKSTGIPTPGSLARPTTVNRPVTPTPTINETMPPPQQAKPATRVSTGGIPKQSASSGNLRASLLPTSARSSHENLVAPSVVISEAAVKEAVKDKSVIKDLTEKLETLKLKRSEDREKLREFEKSKVQILQLQEFKTKAQELMSDLNKQLVVSKQDTKSVREGYAEYKEEMDSVEQRIEEMSVDKEIAEARCEELQDDYDKLMEKNEEIKLELDVLKGEIELNGVGGAAASFESKQIAGEVERLKKALIKLRDLSLQDKTEINGLRKLNADLDQKLKSASKESETLKGEHTILSTQINDLKDQVTATLGSVEMIEQLTEQNLDYETKINELSLTIIDLEAINDVNDQLAESAHEEENEMRQNLDMAESRIRECEKEIEFLKYKIADHERTIVKYRELVQQMGNDNDDSGKKLQSRIDELQVKITAFEQNKTTLSAGSFDFKQKLSESKNYAKFIENEMNKIEIQSLKKYNTYLTTFMSEQFMKRSGDHECILTLLFFKRIISKTELIMDQVKEKYSNLLNKETTISPNLADKQDFVFEILMALMHMKLLANKYDYILNTCAHKVYANIGQMYFDFQMHEKVLDSMLDLLQKDQLEENRNVDMIEKASIHLQTIYRNHLLNEKFDDLKFMADLVVFGEFSCDSITVYLQYIQSGVVNVRDDQTEMGQLLKEINGGNEEMKVFLKKAAKHLPQEKNDEKRIVLILPAELLERLEKSIENFYKISKTLRELNYLASNSSELAANDHGEGGMTSKKLEDLAYQASDKVYLIDDNGPYENLRNTINELHETLKFTISGLSTAIYEKELNDDEYKVQKYLVNSPATLASENFKSSLLEAESIKFKLESKEDEIKEIKRSLKLKVDELSEYKLRISISENKADNALNESEEKNKKLVLSIEEIKTGHSKSEKQQTETIEAMQQEIDNYENEIKELKKKIPKKNPFANSASFEAMQGRSLPNSPIISHAYTASPLADSSMFAQEIKLVRTMNKMLEKNNVELKSNLTEAMMNKLPPLPKITKDSALLAKDESFTRLTRESNDLMKDLYSSLANVKVTELREGSTVSYNAQNNVQFKYYLKSARRIQDKVDQLQKDLKSIDAEGNKGSMNIHEVIKKKTCMAEICLPSKRDADKVVNLTMNLDEMRKLLQNI